MVMSSLVFDRTCFSGTIFTIRIPYWGATEDEIVHIMRTPKRKGTLGK